MLYENDCLEQLKTFPDSCVDMVYLDPPFFSQKKQTLADSVGNKFEFSDKWDSKQTYLDYMKERIIEMRRVLKDSGSIFLHCDTYASHYLRGLLDDVFGSDNFRSEIIWTYRRWSNSREGLLPAHQTIFMYSKSKRFKFNTIYGEYSATTNIDQILQDRERDKNGKAVYKRDETGQTVSSKEKRGVPLSDVWDIPFLNPKAKERTGYPTQKPIELLERIIRISTDSGDCVLDPFCGSGTTLVAAELLGRKSIGIDTNPDAIEISHRRLLEPFKTTSNLLRVGENAYRTKTDEELSILNQFECVIVQRNKGIDAFLKKHYKDGPVAIRIQRNNEPFIDVISKLSSAMQRKKCSFAVLVTNEKDISSYSIPSDIIVIRRYDVQLEHELEKRILKDKS